MSNSSFICMTVVAPDCNKFGKPNGNGTNYSPNAVYSENKGRTLYAQWTAN